MATKGIPQVCEFFGHNWVIRIVKGRPIELCANCGAKAE